MHLRFVREDLDLLRFRIDAQHVVPNVVGDVHESVAVKANSVADALARKRDVN